MTTAYTYNNKGQVLTQTDPKRQTTRYEYDDKGELEMIAEPGGKITRNTYYPDGSMHTMSVCGQPPTVYTYWPDGNIRTETNPDGAVTEYTYFEGKIETETKTRTTEDEAGNPITVTMTPMYEYDSVGRQTTGRGQTLYIPSSAPGANKVDNQRRQLSKKSVSYTDMETKLSIYQRNARIFSFIPPPILASIF